MKGREVKTAKRYAKAFFKLAGPERLDQAAEWLAGFERLWKEHKPLRETLLNPALAEEERLNALGDLAARVSPEPILGDFLKLLLVNRRLQNIPEIRTAFDLLVADFKKVLRLSIVSAFELSAAERTEIESRIREKIPRQYAPLITADWQVERNLIGGLVIKSGDLVLDGSLDGALQRLGDQMRD